MVSRTTTLRFAQMRVFHLRSWLWSLWKRSKCRRTVNMHHRPSLFALRCKLSDWNLVSFALSSWSMQIVLNVLRFMRHSNEIRMRYWAGALGKRSSSFLNSEYQICEWRHNLVMYCGPQFCQFYRETRNLLELDDAFWEIFLEVRAELWLCRW